MRKLMAESFDLLERYRAVRSVRSAMVVERVMVVDVGDQAGFIGAALPGDWTVSVDVATSGPSRGAARVRGSGLSLPFPDAAAGLVVSCDALEHVAHADRAHFLDELVRIAQGPIALTAPFDDPKVRAAESLIRDEWRRRVGEPLAPLEDHLAYGLPDLGATVSHLQSRGHQVVTCGVGNLAEWIVLWLVRMHAAALPAFGVVPIQTALNSSGLVGDPRGPHHGALVVASPPANWEVPQVDVVDCDLDALAAELLGVLTEGADLIDPRGPLQQWATERVEDPTLSRVAHALVDAARQVQASGHRRPFGGGEIAPPVDGAEASLPSAAVIVVNFNGRHHLDACLESLRDLDYPPELVEIVVVENGSTDGSMEYLTALDGITLVDAGANLGFAEGVNRGVENATAEVVALINNDMKADPGWLRALVGRLEPESGVVCVGGTIYDWEGETLDFAGGSVNVEGMGFQHQFGRDLASVDTSLVDGSDVLFACGGSMVIVRDVFLDVGGFDPDYFAYFEDVDFGWRLWLFGYRVRLASDAVTFHRHHGTSGAFPDHQRLLLYERNSMRSVIKNYDSDHLPRALAASLMLGVARADRRAEMAGSPVDRSAFRLGGDKTPLEEVSRAMLVPSAAVLDLLGDLPALLERRAEIQRRRVRSDAEVMAYFGRPTQMAAGDTDYAEAQSSVLRLVGLDAAAEVGRASRVAVVFNEPVGDRLAGPSIRAWNLAVHLARTVEVVAILPEPTSRQAPGVFVQVASSDRGVRDLVDGCDVVVLQGYVLLRYPSLAQSDAIRVVDLYDPWLFENLELHRDMSVAERRIRGDVDVLNRLLDIGDHFICASERQRDYWLGMLSARGRVNAESYRADSSLRMLIEVIPFGLPARPPRRRGPILRGVHPAVGPDTKIVLWGGGIWDWFDPVLVIDAFAKVVPDVGDAVLYFMGTQLPKEDVPDMRQVEAAQQRARHHGLFETRVLFGDWVDYEDREGILLESDIAVSAARDVAETRLSFRSRVLDYFWAGLPIVCTGGDVLADVVAAESVGEVVNPGDVDGFAAGLRWLLNDEVTRESMAHRMPEVAKQYRWDRVVHPLRPLIEAPWRWRELRHLSTSKWVLGDDTRHSIAQRRLELDAARAHIANLEAAVAQKEARLQQLRELPGVLPAFRWARTARDRIRGRGGPSDAAGGP